MPPGQERQTPEHSLVTMPKNALARSDPFHGTICGKPDVDRNNHEEDYCDQNPPKGLGGCDGLGESCMIWSSCFGIRECLGLELPLLILIAPMSRDHFRSPGKPFRVLSKVLKRG